MLLVIHNLPLNIKYADIKSLLQGKCGLTHVILDNLVTEGNMKKVTVGLADDGDAAILVRKINGLYMQGAQLYVEDVRQKKESEQPYRSSKSLLQERKNYNNDHRFQEATGYQDPSDQRSGSQGFQDLSEQRSYQGSQGYQDIKPLLEPPLGFQGSNQMYQSGLLDTPDQMTMMNYNMSMSNMVFVPLAPTPMGFGVHQQQIPPLLPQMPEVTKQTSFNFGRGEPQEDNNQSSRWDDSNRGRNMKRPGNRDRRPDDSSNRRQSPNSNSRWELPPRNPQRNVSQWDEQQELQLLSQNDYHLREHGQIGRERPNDQPRQFERAGDRQRQPDRKDRQRQVDRFENTSFEPSSRNTGSRWDNDLQRDARDFDQPLLQPLLSENWRDESKKPPKRFRDRWVGEPEAKKPAQSRFSDEHWRAPNSQNNNRDARDYRAGPTPSSSRNRDVLQDSPRNRNSTNPRISNSRPAPLLNTPAAWPNPKRAKKDPAASFGPKPNIRKEPVSNNAFKKPFEMKNPSQQGMQQQIQRSETWRGQATATIVKEMLNNMRILVKLTDPIVVQLKLSVRSRINMLLGDDINIQYPEIQALYRKKFPISGDRKLYESVLETNKTLLAEKVNEKHEAAKGSDKSEIKEKEAMPPPKAPAPKSAKPKPAVATEPPPELTPLQLANKIMAAMVPLHKSLGPNAKKTIPNRPGDDKALYNEIKKLEKKEMAEGADIYELNAPLKKVLDESADTLCDLFMGECLEPADEEEKTICEQISDVAADEFRKITRLHITKRLLNITPGLTVLLHVSGKPRINTLEDFLKPYGVISLKKSEQAKGKLYVVTLASYEQFDALCAIGSKDLEDCKINIMPRIHTGQKFTRRGGKNFQLRKKITTLDRSDQSLLQMSNESNQDFSEDVQIIEEHSEVVHTVSDDEDVANGEAEIDETQQDKKDNEEGVENEEVEDEESDDVELIAQNVSQDYDDIDDDDVDEDDLEDY